MGYFENRKLKKKIENHKLRLGLINLFLEPTEKSEKHFKESKDVIDHIINSEKAINLLLNSYQITEKTQLNTRLNKLITRWRNTKRKYNS